MKTTILSALLFLLASCATTNEPTMDGTWDFSMSSPFGQVAAEVTMVVSGTSLTGQFDLGGGRILAIEDGLVEGNTISFTINRDGAAMSYGMTGTVEGANIAGSASAMGAEVPWTMTRGS